MDIDMEWLRWLWAGVLVPVFGGISYWVVRWWRRRVCRRNIRRRLDGLPPESKAVLMEFYVQGTHTVAGNPWEPATEFLVSERFLEVRGSAGGYAAVNRYLTIRPAVFEEVMDWAAREVLAYAEATQLERAQQSTRERQ